MSFREWINNNPAIVAGVVVVMLAIVAAVMLLRSREPEQRGWYYDTGTNTLFAARPEGVVAPSGQEAVRAYVYACDCSDATQHQIAYLERFEGLEALQAAPEAPEGGAILPGGSPEALAARGRTAARSHLIADPSDRQWVASSSPQGQALIQRLARATCPDGTTPSVCRP